MRVLDSVNSRGGSGVTAFGCRRVVSFKMHGLSFVTTGEKCKTQRNPKMETLRIAHPMRSAEIIHAPISSPPLSSKSSPSPMQIFHSHRSRALKFCRCFRGLVTGRVAGFGAAPCPTVLGASFRGVQTLGSETLENPTLPICTGGARGVRRLFLAPFSKHQAPKCIGLHTGT